MTETRQPLVSIVTPSYNQGTFIEKTLLSVKEQTYANIEHLVIDGGSTDHTTDILEKYAALYDLKWISEKDDGQADAINKGFGMAQGEIVGWLNSDDMYFAPDIVEFIVQTFKHNQKMRILYGDGAIIDVNENILQLECKPAFDYSRLLRGCYILQPAVFFRREVIDHFKLDKSLRIGMDYDFWLKVGRRYPFYHVSRILAADRNHAERKIVACPAELCQESRLIQERYGRKNGLWFLWGRTKDKLKSAIYRLKALRQWKTIRSENNFIFVASTDNWFKFCYRQLAKKRESLF